ncbi:MAG: hypothetical protein SFU98_05465 [Leptospiraceae bacterium]|nr:hypothetical protein [Leptospiraceae bacterium]
MKKILLTIILSISLAGVSLFACDGKGKSIETISPVITVEK